MRSAIHEKNEIAALLSARASSLLAAIMALVMLLLAAAMPAELRSLACTVAQARAAEDRKESSNKEPAPTEPPVSVRLAEVDSDVDPQDAARIAVITADVLDKNVGRDLVSNGPTVLVYHTHDTEAYTPTELCPYEPSAKWRTEDPERSVIAVGEELCRILNEQYGILAVHACERHELPLITTAYSRSLETIERYRALYPTLRMFIDLHRDGVPDEGYEDDFVVLEGVEVARMMFVVGTGRGSNGAGTPVPDFEANYALALGITQRLLSYDGGLARKVRVKANKYNQQVSDKSLLVEVGHNANTLEQALAAMPYLAAAIAETAGIPPALTAASFAP